LLYHRIVELSSDPYLLGVKPQRFAEHLEILRKHGRPMQLHQLAQALRDGNLPRRALVVTFDDGYADNLYTAKPLLERFEVPATIFVTTGYIGRDREFWWDELERLLLQPGILPETLRLNIGAGVCEWKLGDTVCYSEDDYQQHVSWNVAKVAPTIRHNLYNSLYQRLLPLAEVERREVLDELLRWAGREPRARRSHQLVSSDEVVRLSEGGVIEIGAHTVNHPALSGLPAAVQRDEVVESKAHLTRILGRRVTSFAYPYGDYTTETAAIVQGAGFDSACSTVARTVRRGTNHFELPRVLVRDCSGDVFDRRLWTFFRDE
jgi:peptidoglycan/xylan/chitin deacetylase (PgdA/CDA1 family)